MRRKFLFISLCLCSCLLASAQYYYASDYMIRGLPWYDFVKDGIYYKFITVPTITDEYTNKSICYIDTSYTDENGVKISDGFETGLPYEGDILWVMGYPFAEQISKNEVVVWNSSYSGDVYVPDSVEYEGKTYAVKGIGGSAFVGRGITSIRLPECLEYLWYCFEQTDDLRQKVQLPNSLKYIANVQYLEIAFMNEDNHYYIRLPENVLNIGNYNIGNYELGYYGSKYVLDSIIYPKNALYGGELEVERPPQYIVYPEKMQHLICGSNVSGVLKGMVIPNNGEFYVHQYGLPRGVSTIYSYAPIMKNCRPGYGFRTLTNVSEDASCQYEKTLYVLPGLKESYAREWPELLAGSPYTTTDGETLYLTEDHIIEVSREEMDAMVEAAGLTVPTAIHEVEVNPSKKVEEAIYTLDGRHWSTLQKGVNIVRQSNGTVRKVYVK